TEIEGWHLRRTRGEPSGTQFGKFFALSSEDLIENTHGSSQTREPVLHHFHPGGGEDGLGMKLNAFDLLRRVTNSHDFAIRRARRHLETVRYRSRLENERMVARGRDWRGDPREDTVTLVKDGTGLSVHEALGAHDFCPENLTNGLVSETHSENGYDSRALFDHLQSDSCVVRGAWARRKEH